MPKYTRKEFLILTGIKSNHFTTYVNRGKIIFVDGVIDTSLDVNQYFVDLQREKSGKKNSPKIPAGKKGAIVPVENKEPVVTDTEQDLNDRVAEKDIKEKQAEFKFPKDHPAQSKNFELDQEIKRQELEKGKLELLLKQSRLDKINGITVPTDSVKTLILHHSKSITIAFHNAAETFLSKIAKQTGIDLSEMASLREELIETVNKAVNDSIEVSKKTLTNIVTEHSQMKEVGERE